MRINIFDKILLVLQAAFVVAIITVTVILIKAPDGHSRRCVGISAPNDYCKRGIQFEIEK